MSPHQKAFLVLLDWLEDQGWPAGEPDWARGSIHSLVRLVEASPEGVVYARAAGLKLGRNQLGQPFMDDWPSDGWLWWAHEEIERRWRRVSPVSATG